MAMPVAAEEVLAPKPAPGSLRVATYNVSMNRSSAGRLTQDLQRGDEQIRSVAAVIRAVKPDILLLNEVDYSQQADHAEMFERLYLRDEQVDFLGNGPFPMAYRFTAPVNTGEPSGLDLNQNARTNDPDDAWGFGRFPGQYGMAVLSRWPIDVQSSRTFQNLRWALLPGALKPTWPDSGKPYYDEATWEKLRLPSKSFWDVVVRIQDSSLHLLASHPTPPAFDGPEDRNGCRNQDEIRLLYEYIGGDQVAASSAADKTKFQDYFQDDQGRSGLLAADANFVILGDLNADPVDGGNKNQWTLALLGHPRVNTDMPPVSQGAEEASRVQGQKNSQHLGPAQQDTSDFNDQVVGNLRVDYALPSKSTKILASGVVWPEQQIDRGSDWAKRVNSASDHHLVWVDILLR